MTRWWSRCIDLIKNIIWYKLKVGLHFSSAATQLENVSIAEAKKQLLHVLDSYLASARTDEDSQNKGK